MSHRFLLRTLDAPALLDPGNRALPLEPRAFALLTLLALAGDDGVPEEELLLRLTPDLTPARGRAALKELGDSLGVMLGAGAIERGPTGTRLRSGLVRLDVERIEPGSAGSGGDRFLHGFSLSDSPELGEWVRATAQRVAPLESVPRTSSRWTRVIPVLVLLGVAMTLIVSRGKRLGGVAFVPGGLVVLADLDNATGDTLFDAGLGLAATVALEQSGRFGLLPRIRIRQALDRAGVPPGDTILDLERAREAAARNGVRYVIAPRITTESGGYRVSAILLDAMDDRLLTEASASAEGPAGVLPALDQVLRSIREALGETASQGLEPDAPLPQVTTPSLEALRSYARGVRAWRDGEYHLASQYWHRALAQDSGFAMAYASLSNASTLNHDRDSARYYHDMALARATRLTEWEQLRLKEAWASSRGDHDSAVKIAAAIAERFSNTVTHYNLGTTLMQANRCPEARAPFERALELDSMSYIAHINLATCARREGALRESAHHYEQAAAIFPPAVVRGNPAYEFAGVLVALGLEDSARRQFERIASQTALFDRTLGLRGLAFLSLLEGRDLEAARHFEATVEIGRQQRARLSLARGYMFTALAYSMGGHSASAGKAFAEMLEIIRAGPLVPQMLALAGWALCRTGRISDAMTVLERLRQQANGSQDDRGAEAFLVGALALARGDPARADSVLATGPAFVQPRLADLLRADALERLGLPDSARSLRQASSRTVVFGSESHFEQILQDRAASARTPTGQK